MGKKIAVFTVVWNSEYLYPFLQGLRQSAKEHHADLYIFNSYGDYDRDYETFTNGEYEIFSLPDMSEFDGAIIAVNNVGSEYWVERLRQKINEQGIPCIYVEQEMDADHTIGVDNYQAMYDMVEHLVSRKHCRTLNYVGGPSDNRENQLRKAAFLDVLRRYGLECDPRRIRDYSFISRDGSQAYEDFKALGLDQVDAVVCANDSMAIGYLKGAEADGRSAPEDFLITGFDNTKSAQQYYPSISSVERNRYLLGRSSIDYLLALRDKKLCPQKEYVPYQLVLRQSTGDRLDNENDQAFRLELYNINARNFRTRLNLKHMRTALLGRRSPEEFEEIVSRFAPMMGMNRFLAALDSRRIIENSQEERRFFGNYDGQHFLFSGGQESGLIPPQWRQEDGLSHTYLFSPCHCNGKKFGYWVTIDNVDVIRENLLSEWMLALDNAMENLRQNLHLQVMNRKLRELYRQDPLTGLYNRFALNELGEQLLLRNQALGCSTLIIFVDMDSLKKANDIYGHDVGDLALKTIADGLKQVCDRCLDFAVRYGGDEFLLLGTYPGEAETLQIMQEVERTITELGSRKQLPFPLSASTGAAEIPPDASSDLEAFIRQADQRMYKRKTEKKRLADR